MHLCVFCDMAGKKVLEGGNGSDAALTVLGGRVNRNHIRAEAWEAYLESLRKGARFTHAAKAAGISYMSVLRRRECDPEFVDAERAAEVVACEVIEDAVFEAARKGNMTAALHWLGNRAPDRWHDARRPDKQVVQVDVGGSVALDAGATFESVLALAEKLKARAAIESGPGRVIDAEVVSES